ncbi:methyl-accepting chemotaxis protein [Algiphilus sp.]|uniref:methyl-accepting chemotaxis protein n=1 Tax=Algiphilus sp. TaxID=1872431 RepID=UPI0025C640A2|nr:methyl-accepting chemotaxis protein [Algiphilus sp.]MCK5771943.1 methyl-accepting chemotaxis protein [Algiphilus sp.]
MAATEQALARVMPRLQIGLLVLAAVLIAGAVFNFLYVQQQQDRNAALETLAFDVRTFYETITQSARESSQGLEPDRSAMFAMQDNYEDLRATLLEGAPARDIPALPENYDPAIADLHRAWERVVPVIEAIIAGLPTAQRTKVNAATIDATIADLRAPADALVDGTRGNTLADTALLRARLEQLRTIANRMIQINARATEEAEILADTVARTEAILGDLQNRLPGDLRDELAVIAEAMEPLRANAEALIEAAPQLDGFNDANIDFYSSATSIETAAGGIENLLLRDMRATRVTALPSYLMGAGAVLALIAFIGLFIYQLRREARIANERDRRQQDAILTLLDEITNLADGDLTVGVTVTEDFTGAIADSINFTVENMRGLVGQINAASAQIADAAAQTQSSVEEMSRSSERQAQQTDQATQTITQVSKSLEETAERAGTASSQAQESVRVAHTGAETVDRTIDGMNTLREQIQDTSKRMKRLGESSQEIGNITELINDIAEQTNTLALNASIQAAMAGEAGRGFAVVADEVQRLAERAGNATRQIENLVKTIQADTNEAIVSMERSTSNVVSGASTAEEAGQALTQIERASTELARLIDEITTSVRTRAREGTEVAGTMQTIREVAVQTAGSSRQTAQDVGKLTALSATLRESVAGFNLPEEQRGTE